jgi:hypothetical protein
VSKAKVTCPNCGKNASVELDKLPNKAVRIACPGCSKPIVLEKSKLMKEDKGEPEAPPAEVENEAPPATDPDLEASLESSAPHEVAQHVSPAMQQPLGDDRQAALPAGVVYGDDALTVTELSSLFTQNGAVLRPVTAEALEVLAHDDLPELVICVAKKLNGPPCELLAPLRSLPPKVRRDVFVVLIADKLKTLDGSAAFFFEVNMVIAKGDLESALKSIGAGIAYQQNLYKVYRAAVQVKEGLTA